MACVNKSNNNSYHIDLTVIDSFSLSWANRYVIAHVLRNTGIASINPGAVRHVGIGLGGVFAPPCHWRHNT